MCSVLKIIPLAKSKVVVRYRWKSVGVIVEVGVDCGLGRGVSGMCMQSRSSAYCCGG